MTLLAAGFAAHVALTGVAGAEELPRVEYCFRNETQSSMQFSVEALARGGDKAWGAATIALFPSARGCWTWDRDNGLWETVDVFVRPKEPSNVELPESEKKRWHPCLGGKGVKVEYVVRMIGDRLRCGTAANLERY